MFIFLLCVHADLSIDHSFSVARNFADADEGGNVRLGGTDSGHVPHRLLLVPASVPTRVGVGPALFTACPGI